MTQSIAANSVGAGVRILALNFESIFVTEGTVVGSTTGTAVVANGGDHLVAVDGTLIGHDSGLLIGHFGGSDNEVVVGQTGTIRGEFAGINVESSSSHIVNNGEIYGFNKGLSIAASQASFDTIVNNGLISGGTAMSYSSAVSGSVLNMINHGAMIAGTSGIAYFAIGTADETIRNTGEIFGVILFGAGNDTYDGRGGEIDSTVSGQTGNDTFIAGRSVETFDGGDGTDLLDFSRSGGVIVSLDNSVDGTRGAEDDTYLNIEMLLGSRTGADELYGDGGNNLLWGQGGADALSGGLGADRLSGGTDKDQLTGGGGNDTIVFNGLGDCGDTIADFSGLVGNDDVVWIKAAAFGGGLVAGVALAAGQFQTGAGHAALGANVRFIYDTATTSLWYDVNGNAAGGLTMVADLQDAASFGISDVVLF